MVVLDRLLFSEGGARVLISCSEEQSIEFKEYCKNIFSEEKILFSISYLGQVTSQKELSIYQSNNLLLNIKIEELINTYKNAIFNKVSKKK